MNEDIPLSKIHEGYHLHENLIESFLKTSEKLFEDKEYTNSILFSILAWEEMSKLLLLSDYIKQEWKDIPHNEWKKRTNSKKVHSFKLTDMIESRKKRLQSRTKEELEKIKTSFAEHDMHIDLEEINKKSEDDDGIQMLKKLNESKKLIMYNHWNGKSWVVFNKITKSHERKIMAGVLLEMVKGNFFSLSKVRISGAIKSSDELFKKFFEHTHRLNSLEFLTDKEIMNSILDRIQEAYYNHPSKKE